MRKTMLLAAIASVAIAAQAQAAVVYSTGFESPYTLGELNTQNGWAGTPAVYNVVSGGLGAAGGSQALRFTQANGNPRMATTYAAQSSDVFYSFNLQSNGANFCYFALDNDTDEASLIGIALRFDSFSRVCTRVRNTGVQTQGLGPTIDETSTLTQQVVVRVAKNATANYNEISAWVNPAFADLATPQILTTANSGLSSLTTFYMRTGGATANTYTVDNLAIATTWSDVVAVPEPAMLSLIGLAGLALIRRRHA